MEWIVFGFSVPVATSEPCRGAQSGKVVEHGIVPLVLLGL